MHREQYRGVLRIGKLQGSGEVAFAANFDIVRFGLRRSANERADVIDRQAGLAGASKRSVRCRRR